MPHARTIILSIAINDVLLRPSGIRFGHGDLIDRERRLFSDVTESFFSALGDVLWKFEDRTPRVLHLTIMVLYGPRPLSRFSVFTFTVVKSSWTRPFQLHRACQVGDQGNSCVV